MSWLIYCGFHFLTFINEPFVFNGRCKAKINLSFFFKETKLI